MGFLDTLFGRTKPVQPKLDDLFGLPSAAVQLEAATGFKPTGSGSVSFRAPEGKPFADIQKEVLELLDMDNDKPGGGLPVEVTKDSYGYTWLVSNHMSDEMDALVTDLHAVNTRADRRRLRPAAAVHARRLQRRQPPPPLARLPLQARHVLPIRPARQREQP